MQQQQQNNYLRPPQVKLRGGRGLCVHMCPLTCSVRQKVINLAIDSEQWHTLALRQPQTVVCSSRYVLGISQRRHGDQSVLHTPAGMLLVLCNHTPQILSWERVETLLNLSPAVVLWTIWTLSGTCNLSNNWWLKHESIWFIQISIVSWEAQGQMTRALLGLRLLSRQGNSAVYFIGELSVRVTLPLLYTVFLRS